MSPVRLRVQEFRESRDWSQAELARRSGVPQSTISRLEAGTTGVINLDHLDRLAKALGVHPRELVLRTGD
jgi:putative transcriptional regulator